MVSADYTSSAGHWSTYKPTDFECAKCTRCVQTFVSAAHEDVLCLTLRPIEYRPPGEGPLVTFGGVGGRQAFILEVIAWATKEAIDPVSRPSHNLSGNGRAATSRDTGMTNRDLGASRGATRG